MTWWPTPSGRCDAALGAAAPGRRATPAAGPSASTTCSAPPPSCWSGARRAWSPPGCWPAPSAGPVTTPRDLALAASLARSSKDLEEHEYAVRSVAEALAPHCTSINVPESPVRAPAGERDAPGDRRHRRAGGRRHRPGPGRRRCTPPPRCAARRPRPRPALIGEIEGMDRGPLRRAGRLDRRHGRRRVGHRPALRPVDARGPAPAAPLRRLRDRRRLGPAGRARRVRRQAGADAGRPHQLSASPTAVRIAACRPRSCPRSAGTASTLVPAGGSASAARTPARSPARLDGTP